MSEILVVLGHRAAEIEAQLSGEGVRCLHNARYPEGMLTSIQAGVAAADPDAEWFLIALADQPALRPEVVVRLLEAAAEAGPGAIVVPSYQGRRGHPLLLSAGYREEILALPSEGGLRTLLQRYPASIQHVAFMDDHVLSDMDTPEDYRRELRRLADA